MTATVKNTVFLAWRIEEGDYAYQGQYEYTQEEYAALDWDQVRERQDEEFAQWRVMFDNMKAQQ
jgi:hypothetical protein